MNVLSITGAPQTGKTTALIGMAQTAVHNGPTFYVSPWMQASDRFHLDSRGMPRDVKLISASKAADRFRALRPVTVLIDDANALTQAQRDELLEICDVAGARFVAVASL